MHIQIEPRQNLFNHLLNHFKVGYFRKQGFIKEIGLDKSVYHNYIKEYVGATVV